MVGTLGYGFQALRALALRDHVVLPENAKLCQKLYEDLTYEAQKFLIFRQSRMMDRELLSIHRVRSLLALIRHS